MIQRMAQYFRMNRISLLVLSLLLLSCCSFGQNPQNERGDALADALVKWKTDCYPKGCLMQTDVLRGQSEKPPDANDFREYIGIDIGVDRKTQKPLYFAFHVDPDAQPDQGVFIAFTKTTKDGTSWKINLDKDGASRIPFERC
jgi:hypothetical protein